MDPFFDESQDCPLPPVESLSADETKEGLTPLLQALGNYQCHSTTAGGGGVVLYPPAIVAGGATTSVGCEQLTVVSQAISQIQQQITCLINRFNQSTSTLINQTNSIEIRNPPPSTRLITLMQLNRADTKVAAEFQSSVLQDIHDAGSQLIDTMVSNISKSKIGWLTTAQGQKAITDLKSLTQAQDYQKALTDASQSLTATINQSNQIVLDWDKAIPNENLVNYSNLSIDLSQINVSSYQAQAYMTTLVKGVFDSTLGQSFKSVIKNHLDAEAAGIESFISALTAGLFGLLLIGVILFLVFGGSAISSILKWIVPLAIIGAIVAAVIFGLEHPPKVIATVACGIVSVVLGVLEFFIIKKSNK